MVERLLQLDDVRHTETPEKIAILFHKLGYNAIARQLAVDDLELPVISKPVNCTQLSRSLGPPVIVGQSLN